MWTAPHLDRSWIYRYRITIAMQSCRCLDSRATVLQRPAHPHLSVLLVVTITRLTGNWSYSMTYFLDNTFPFTNILLAIGFLDFTTRDSCTCRHHHFNNLAAILQTETSFCHNHLLPPLYELYYTILLELPYNIHDNQYSATLSRHHRDVS